jgi:DNA-binding response OmpR family regulator
MPDAFRVVALSRALLSTGLLPSLAFSPAELLTYLRIDDFSVLVLHLAIVGPPLRAALGRARASARTPVLYVGSSSRPDAAAGDLGSGGHVADGSPPDAIAALAASLAARAAAPPSEVLRWGALRMDLGRREAWWAARRLDLTSMQFRSWPRWCWPRAAWSRPWSCHDGPSGRPWPTTRNASRPMSAASASGSRPTLPTPGSC